MVLKNLRIKSKLLVSFTALILLTVFVTGIGIYSINHLKEDGVEMYQQIVKPLGEMEELKYNFAELRRLVLLNTVHGMDGDQAAVEKGIERINEQYAALRDSFQIIIKTLEAAGVDEARIEQARMVQDMVDNEYWPVIKAANDLGKPLDVETMLNQTKKSTEINEFILSNLSSRMAEAFNKTEDITKSANECKVLLLIAALLSAIMSIAFALYIGNMITNPIIRLKSKVEDLANGNLDVNLRAESKDEIGELTNGLAAMTEMIKDIMSDVCQMSAAITEGEIDAKVDCSRLTGAYKNMGDGVNNMISGIFNDLATFLDCMITFSGGDFTVDMPEFPGKKAVMNQTLNSMRDSLNTVSNEINTLINAAVEGKLSARADAAGYKGGWSDIMERLNMLMEAVASPILEAERVLSQVAEGDFGVRLIGDYNGDFLKIKNSVNNMVENISSYIDEISKVLTALSLDNLDQSVEREYVGRFSDIKDALNNIIDKFNRVITEIGSSAEQVASGAKQVAESSMMLAQGTDEQAAAIDELSATVQTINNNTMQNAESAKDAEGLSEHSKTNAAKGDHEMRNMLVSMSGIKESSNNISKIIKVIDDIAFQTNLLALNAAVEAARAGASGKGFAVVAGEVRDLAARSKEAAKETAGLIEESMSRVDEGTHMADMTADALGTIVENVTKVAGIISDIAIASDAQANAISQVTEGITQITEVVQNNSATSQEAASASEELSSQAELLRNLVGVFKLKKTFSRQYYRETPVKRL